MRAPAAVKAHIDDWLDAVGIHEGKISGQ